MITGNNIKAIRETLGESQKEFAKRLGLFNYQRVQEIEYLGKKRVGATTERKIRDLGLDKYLPKK